MKPVSVFHSPRSVAIIGASNDPEKIGGRPIRYMRENGFAGALYPVNPGRAEVQGLAAYPSIADLPEVPDVVIVAVGGSNAVDQVVACAELGVSGCIVMASGFGETGDAEGLEAQERMLSAARRSGMRIVGPNSQGLANFGNGAVLSFSTLFTEQPPSDGPVAIVSQSGAMCSIPYGMLREAGIGVRYAHGTGNDIDVSAAELAADIVTDPAIRLLILYLEDLRDPDSLAGLAAAARERGLPIIALKGGRSEAGQRAAASHTGALANEERVVDAFLRKHGIWRVDSTRDLVSATELYLRAGAPDGDGIAIVSNSGAVCVLTADAADDHGLTLAELSPATREALDAALPAFAATENPIDVTAALLTDSSLFGKVLPVIGADSAVRACVIGIPVAGRGYDVERFADDIEGFERSSGMPVVMVVPQRDIAEVFRQRGLVVFADEATAVAALAQFMHHHRLMERAAGARHVPYVADPSRGSRRTTLNEAESLAVLQRLGIPVAPHVLVRTAAEAAEAFARLGGGAVVVKGCTSDTTHKSDLGLVRIGVESPDEAVAAVGDMFSAMERHGLRNEGALVSQLVRGVHEGMLGGHIDPVFGPVVLIGAGGVYVEAMPDARVLIPPFSISDAQEAIGQLRIAAVLRGARGKPPVDVGAWAEAAVRLGDALVGGDLQIDSLDVNPLMLLELGGDAQPAVQAVDGVVILSGRGSEARRPVL